MQIRAPLFEVGSLLRPRSFYMNCRDEMRLKVWGLPHEKSLVKFTDVPIGYMEYESLAVVLAIKTNCYKVLTSSGLVGWIDSWDVEYA